MMQRMSLPSVIKRFTPNSSFIQIFLGIQAKDEMSTNFI